MSSLAEAVLCGKGRATLYAALLLVVVCAVDLPACAAGDGGNWTGQIVTPGVVSTYSTELPLADDERDWEEAFYEVIGEWKRILVPYLVKQNMITQAHRTRGLLPGGGASSRQPAPWEGGGSLTRLRPAAVVQLHVLRLLRCA